MHSMTGMLNTLINNSINRGSWLLYIIKTNRCITLFPLCIEFILYTNYTISRYFQLKVDCVNVANIV